MKIQSGDILALVKKTIFPADGERHLRMILLSFSVTSTRHNQPDSTNIMVIILRNFLTLLFIACNLVSAHAQTEPDSLKIYSDKGLESYNTGNYVEAENQFLLAADFALRHKSPEYVEILNNLGNIAGYVGQAEKAISYYQDALRQIHLSKKPREFEAKILKNIGATYSDLEDFKNAMSYLRRAEEIANELHDEDLIADCLNNRGIIYEQTDSMSLALDVYAQALSIYRKSNDPDRLALVFINIGVVSKSLLQLENAKAAYDSALHYSRLIGNEYYISATLNNLGNVLVALHDYKSAIQLTQEALHISQRIGHTDVEQNCLSSLAEQYHAMGMNDKAYLYQQRYSAFHDSLINVSRVNALTEMETKYEVEKKELQLSTLSLENELKEKENRQNKLYMVLLAIGFVVLSASGLVWLRFNKLRQKKKELELVAFTEKSERERIAKDMHDELGTGISRITWITAMAEKNIQDENLKKQIGSIENISGQLATGMKSLIWLLNSGNCEWQVLSGRIRELAALQAEDHDFKIIFNDISIPRQKIVQQYASRDIFLLCKEAMNNISKYANASTVKLIFELSHDKFFMQILDDGIGFDPKTITRGHGLNNLQKRAQDMKGNVVIESSPGNGCKISAMLSPEAVFV